MAWSLIANTVKVKATTDAIDTTGADLLIVAVSSYSVTPVTVSDSKSNTWTALTEKANGNCHLRLFYCQGGTVGSAHTFSTNANFYAISVAAFSGSAATPFDVENGATGVSPLQTGSITPSQDGDLIISAVGQTADGAPAGLTWSVNSSLTITNQTSPVSGSNDGIALAYFAQTTAAAINPTWTVSSGTPQEAAVIASFKGAAGGGGAVNGVGQADGVSTVTAGAFATHNVAGTSAGTATVTAGAAAIHNVVGTSAGTASVAGTLITGNEKDTVGQADGLATVTAVGAAVHYVSGTSAGLGDATGSVAIIKNTVGQSDGLSTVTGDGQAVIGGQGVGQADGIATVSGIAAIIKNAIGTSAGASSADGVNPQTVVTQTLTIVGAGGAEEKDWRDHVRELNARNSGLRKKLASKKRELKRLEKKIKTVEVEYKTGKTEGILANLYRLEMQKEEVKNEIKAVEVDLTGLILVLQKVEIEEDDADFFSLQ